jgi:hypothetical protein
MYIISNFILTTYNTYISTYVHIGLFVKICTYPSTGTGQGTKSRPQGPRPACPAAPTEAAFGSPPYAATGSCHQPVSHQYQWHLGWVQYRGSSEPSDQGK